MSTADDLKLAIRAFTVDMPDGKPNGKAEEILQRLVDLCDTNTIPRPAGGSLNAYKDAAATIGLLWERLGDIAGAFGELCEEWASDTHALRVAAEAHFGEDFQSPKEAPRG